MSAVLKLLATLDDLIQFDLFSDSLKLYKHLKKSGVEVTKGTQRQQLLTGYYPAKMMADPRFDEARAVAPKKRFISVLRGETKEAALGMSPIETMWHESGHAFRKSSQINPNLRSSASPDLPRYKDIHQIAAERGANRQTMRLADQLQVSPESRTRIRNALKKSFKTYKQGLFEDKHYSWEGGKRMGSDPMLKAALKKAESPFQTAMKLQETLRAKKLTMKAHPWLRGYKFSQFLDGLVSMEVKWRDNPLYPEDTRSTVQKVPIESIVSHQDAVKEHIVKKYKEHPPRDLPTLHKVGSQYIVEDGNHRIVAKKEKGEKTIRARVLRILSSLDDLIEFQSEQGNRAGKIVKDALIGGGVSALGTAGLLAGAGRGLRRAAPELSGMLRTAAGQHVKVFNPAHTVPMMRSLPEASRLFGKQLRSVREVENIATRGKVPSMGELKQAYQRSGVNAGKDVKDVASFKKQWGRTPGETMEKSVGLLSGLAATGVGVTGGAALSKGWKKPELPPQSQPYSLSQLNDLIEFKLYQPKSEDEPPKDLPQFRPGQTVDYVEQEHDAKRAGKHTDIRIGGKRGMFSWATRKDLPEPGGRIQLHPQPVHPQSYNRFEGEISSGYGAGTVKTRHLGRALVTRSDPGQTNITVGTKRGSNRLAILNTKIGHLLVREKHPEPPTAVKPAYRSLERENSIEYLKSLPKGSIVQPKIDGALVHVKSEKGKLEIFSHRKSKSGAPLLHTERFFKGRPEGDLEGKTILGELYGTHHGKAIEPQELGGILNSHIAKSLEKQKQQNVKLKIMPFDLQDKGTYPERLSHLKQLVEKHLPRDKFTLPEEAKTPKEALRLHERIRAGRHPLTREGIIVHPPTGKMIKVKNTQETNVKIADTFPGTGKFSGSPGGFVYADRRGNPVGKVGTGFSDETRRELKKYVGRTARIRHQGQYESGAYRAPSFIAVDESR